MRGGDNGGDINANVYHGWSLTSFRHARLSIASHLVYVALLSLSSYGDVATSKVS